MHTAVLLLQSHPRTSCVNDCAITLRLPQAQSASVGPMESMVLLSPSRGHPHAGRVNARAIRHCRKPQTQSFTLAVIPMESTSLRLLPLAL